jgi:hypothetical protein
VSKTECPSLLVLFCIADGEYRVNAPCRELTLEVARPRLGRAGYDKAGIEERVEESVNKGWT